MDALAIEKRTVSRWFIDGRGFASLGALCRFVARRQIGKEIRDLIESRQLQEEPGKDLVAQALVIRYGLTWEPSHMDYDRPSKNTRELYDLEVRYRAEQIRAQYETREVSESLAWILRALSPVSPPTEKSPGEER